MRLSCFFVCLLLNNDLAFAAKEMVLLTAVHSSLVPPSFLEQEGGFVWVHSRLASEDATRLNLPWPKKQKD